MRDISFVIRAHNEERWVGHAIQSVLDAFGNKTSIQIVYHQSSDDTLSVIKLFGKNFYNVNVMSIDEKIYRPGLAINRGVSLCETDVVGILSSHCEIVSVHKEKILKYFDDEKCFGVMGKQVPIYRGKRITPRYVWKNFVGDVVKRNVLEDDGDNKRPFFHNAFSFISKSIWEQNKFDERLAGKEDRYWAKDLCEKGLHFWLDPDIVCDHHWTPNGATWSGIG